VGKNGDDRRRGGSREPLTLKVEYADADDLVADYTENISHGGLFVLTQRDLHEGDPIKLVLSFPGLIKPLPLTGTIKWTRDGADDERGVGIAFDASSEASARVAGLIERIAVRDPDLVGRVLDVLVVEDNPHVAQLIRDGLTRGGSRELGTGISFRFHSAVNGKEALEFIHQNQIDLVIIDIYLPILDGAQVIKEARGDGSLKGVPIIAVSAGGASARDAAISAGADFFLDKPMRLADIVATMRRLTGLVPP
jgi:uncharacterized protein (TIGR02266 family)